MKTKVTELLNMSGKALKLAIPATILAATLSVSVVAADGWGCNEGKRGRGHDDARMEHMFDRLDLTKAQEQQVEAIMDRMRGEQGDKKERKDRRHEAMQEMMKLKPEDADYDAKVKAQADKMAKQMSEHIVKMAQMRKEIRAVLTEEQRTKMDQQILDRMDKGKSRNRDDDRHDD